MVQIKTKSRLNIQYYPTTLGSELQNSLYFHMDGSVVQSRVEVGPIEGRVVQLKTPAKGKKTYMIFFSPASFLNFTVSIMAKSDEKLCTLSGPPRIWKKPLVLLKEGHRHQCCKQGILCAKGHLIG